MTYGRFQERRKGGAVAAHGAPDERSKILEIASAHDDVSER